MKRNGTDVTQQSLSFMIIVASGSEESLIGVSCTADLTSVDFAETVNPKTWVDFKDELPSNFQRKQLITEKC